MEDPQKLDQSKNLDNSPDITKSARELVAEIKADATVPRRIKRIACRSDKWGIPRSFVGYKIDPTIQALGNARKWILTFESNPADFYILKYPDKFGIIETLTELLINQLGSACGLEMAHSGVGSADGKPVFITRSFLEPGERLVHGSFLIEEHFKASDELSSIRRNQEQRFYSVDFIIRTIEEYCGSDGSNVIAKFVQMLVFDAVIGTNDRHPQNWGVIRASKSQGGYRFAPIFDTSRALLWNTSEEKLVGLQRDERLIRHHINRSRPILGPEKSFFDSQSGPCNHFQFLESLFLAMPHLRHEDVTKVPREMAEVASRLMDMFPFRGAFSPLRREMVIKLLSLRANEVSAIMQKGGTPC